MKEGEAEGEEPQHPVRKKTRFVTEKGACARGWKGELGHGSERETDGIQ